MKMFLLLLSFVLFNSCAQHKAAQMSSNVDLTYSYEPWPSSEIVKVSDDLATVIINKYFYDLPHPYNIGIDKNAKREQYVYATYKVDGLHRMKVIELPIRIDVTKTFDPEVLEQMLQ